MVGKMVCEWQSLRCACAYPCDKSEDLCLGATDDVVRRISIRGTMTKIFCFPFAVVWVTAESSAASNRVNVVGMLSLEQ
jgi:hypothetical protein